MAKKNNAEEVNNSLGSLVSSLYNSASNYGYPTVQLSQTETLYKNNRWYLISNERNLLNQVYVEHGIVQTLVDQPVDDAFRTGYDIKTGELDGDEIEQLEVYMERFNVNETIIEALKWARLFGGGAILLITDENPERPFNIKNVNKKTKIEFRAVDMWELYQDKQNIQGNITVDKPLDEGQEYYTYYGHKIHRSRVYRIEGKKPPSFVRPRLRGWGLSVMEKLVRSLNQFMKNQDVVFDLLDEAKVDVYKMKGFNSALMTSNGTNQVSNRIQHANMIKNYNHALTMDVDDDYVQKQVNFTGLSDVLVQIRQQVAADLKMPMTKLFGISSAGFNSGDDDIENYNSMIESEIRSKVKFIVVDILSIACMKLFEFVPEDLIIKFKPLRILSAKEEEEVKNAKFNRSMSAFQAGLSTAQETKESFNKDSLLPVELDEQSEALPPIEDNFLVSSDQKVDA